MSVRFFPERRCEAVHGILRRTLRGQKISRRLAGHLSPAAWEEAVGPELAARAQPTVISGGTLHLLVADYRWRDQIDAARELVIAHVNRRLGRNAVRELQFGLAHDGALPAARPPTPDARCAGEAREAELCPDGVAGARQLSDELREAIVRAATAAARARRVP